MDYALQRLFFLGGLWYSPAEQQAWVRGRKKDTKTGEDVLLLVEQKDLQAVKLLQRLLHQMEPEGLGVPILLDSDAQLFPTVADMVAGWPWKMRRVTRFERPLYWEDRTKRWAVATSLTRASRENGLQPNFHTTRLGEVAEPMYRFKVDVPEVSKDTCAIQLDN